ncbi:TetR/AcrR family transcriptional regulator [Glycomyces xiaoerkulensis]|uniref:TetR/AcrR family transcriptional regulator n=1 Tax=Glycomyces xiaoerkulensis TaxID=2038139 RepID=UPI000C266C40|nr:TetR/AcrR family transcriptional regulator [Glycomyces xiaoerkulensis]
MTQRDALLEGAKRCLVEKGYGSTTARDIAAASGAHLGSIGYHFGSKDHLLNLAVIELSGEWGDAIERAARAAGGTNPAARLESLLAELLATLPGSLDVQSASIQALAQAQFDDELRRELAAGQPGARRELAAIVLGVRAEEVDEPTAHGLGSLVYALVTGMLAQALIDLDALPDRELIAAALGMLTGVRS